MSDDAIPAATLIVVRERAGSAPELLMVERAGGMAFAAGALVFPGGRIDDADRQLGKRSASTPLPSQRSAKRSRKRRSRWPVPVPDAATSRALQDALVTDEPFASLLANAASNSTRRR